MVEGVTRFAAWQHREARDGFEVVFIDGRRYDGETDAVEERKPWAVGCVIELAPDGATRSARVSGLSARGRREVMLEADGAGRWRLDGEPAPHLDGCLDVDLEFECELAYDEAGLVLDYPGIAVRVG